ncbi:MULTISPECIES: hypothetical protein [unclassified Bacillus (in: firmicutes)]|uniref:hypothetical protein n=1 Tax=unclassified Bacillus (in: firmicutes) TaxID=185979 RepID=UPI001BE64FD5|nr:MULTISPECIES: hypothetical protein [unclassified Bacillus (in: firmicutes)]MBT2636910.1 hypothetical protein [Bacillus sp. ISL-39]MBT2659997.1 hypothetical protein [Bacillus sp. ISL-45]
MSQRNIRLIQEYGKEVVVELIEDSKETEGFYRAVERITEKPVAEFEQDELGFYR